MIPIGRLKADLHREILPALKSGRGDCSLHGQRHIAKRILRRPGCRVCQPLDGRRVPGCRPQQNGQAAILRISQTVMRHNRCVKRISQLLIICKPEFRIMRCLHGKLYVFHPMALFCPFDRLQSAVLAEPPKNVDRQLPAGQSRRRHPSIGRITAAP